MKKMLFLFFVVILFACEKSANDETYCWKCRRDVFTPGANYSVMIQSCDETEKSIQAFEDENTYISGTTTVSMKCWKEGDPPII